MSARTNAREFANGFVYWQSEIRRAEEIPESTSRLRDLILLRSAATELVREEVNYLCDGDVSDSGGEISQMIQDVVQTDNRMFAELSEWIASALCGDRDE